jgi:hypothetical protein
MLRLLSYGAVAVLLLACQQTSSTQTATTDSAIDTHVNDVLLNTDYNTHQLQGLYTGQFDGSPISISINYVSGKNVSGYDVHKGLKRNLRGKLEPMGSRFKLMLDEPGDNRYDGHFELFIDTASYTGQGTWAPRNDSTLEKKTFALTRQKTDDGNELVSSWSDTLNRTIDIRADGSAMLSYYVAKGTPQEQMEKVSGNWQQKRDSLLLFWQPNTIFPNRRTALHVVRIHADGDTTLFVDKLVGESVEWYNDAP